MVFGHVGKKVAELLKKVEWLEFQPSSTETNQALRSTRSEQNCWLEKQDEMWRQRSRLNWFQDGDRNTSFFHAKASSRQKKNLTEFTELLATVQRKVTPAMNHQLTREYSVQEVKAALKQMYPLKPPGPDGMPPLFF